MQKRTRILLIGRGRLAKHLTHWVGLYPELSLVQWNRSEPVSQLYDLISACDSIWLAISDSAIENFYLTHLKGKDKTVVHFSGTYYHPQLFCAHPLMSFTSELYSEKFYRQIHFVIDNSERLTDIMPYFENAFTRLSAEQKKLYHALCVVAGNLPQLLWSQAEHFFNQLQIPNGASHLYIQQITENYLSLKKGALTGPLVRGDQITIQNNIESLTVSPLLQKVYLAFHEAVKKDLL